MLTILAIMAILGSAVTLLFKCTRTAISIWPESGHIYYILMWCFFIIPLGAICLIVFDIVRYVVADLKRYNLIDKQYETYDRESDEKYSLMIFDFKIMLGVIIFFIIVQNIINSYLQKNLEVFISMLASTLMIIIAVFYFFINKIIKRSDVFKGAKRIVALAIAIVLVFVIAVVFIIKKDGQVDITFDTAGKITIENSIDEEFGMATINVYDLNMISIMQHEVRIDEILLAKESKTKSAKNDIGKEIGRAQEISGEMLYWTYQYNLNDIDLDNGRYYVTIDIKQENKDVHFINMFEKKNNVYMYGKEMFSKKY